MIAGIWILLLVAAIMLFIDNDELQVCAQALCLEEMLGKSITQGYVYYAQSHQRQLVEITEALRQETISTIHAVTTLGMV
jgi:CRISPR-associated exonuclease Cas4